MTDTTSSVIPEVKINNGQAVTTSIAIANFFRKLHKDVLRKIESLECSPQFASAHFCAHVQEVEIGNGATRDSKIYEITKNGFVFLVMGFTGKKAAAFKEAYIAEFDRMEAELLQAGMSAAPYQFDGRLLITVKNGIMVKSEVLGNDQHVATIPAFIEIARKAHYIIIHEDDAAPLISALTNNRATTARRALANSVF